MKKDQLSFLIPNNISGDNPFDLGSVLALYHVQKKRQGKTAWYWMEIKFPTIDAAFFTTLNLPIRVTPIPGALY